MIITPQYEDMIRRHDPVDGIRFSLWTKHLPKRDDETPFHCGAHSLRAMELAYRICGKPKTVLEIGFCLGHSASVWLELGAQHVTSVEISERSQTLEARAIMERKWGERFRFVSPNDFKFTNGAFDMAFIDGGHDFADVANDIRNVLSLKIPRLVFDDIGDKWGPGVEPAIHHHSVIIDAIVGNLAVCRPPQAKWINS